MRAGRHRQAIRADACAKQRKKNQQRQSSSSAKGQPDWPVQFSSRNGANQFAQRQRKDEHHCPVVAADCARTGCEQTQQRPTSPNIFGRGLPANQSKPAEAEHKSVRTRLIGEGVCSRDPERQHSDQPVQRIGPPAYEVKKTQACCQKAY